MKNLKIITISIILLIFVYIIASQVYLMSLGNIYTFIINPLFFAIVALTLKLSMSPLYSTNKFKKDVIQYVLIIILLYSLVYLLSGLLVGFGKNPYSSSVKGIIINLYSTGLIILCKEYIRYKLLSNVYNEDKNLIFVLMVITFTLLDFNVISLISNMNFYYLFKQMFYILIPSILKNILFTYLVKYTDYFASFIYEIIYYLTLWVSPILPNAPWVFEAILNSVFPLMLLLYCKYFIHKKDRFHLNSISQPINPSGLIPFGVCLVLIVWFTLGIFPVKPVGIATASMQPNLNVGDAVIIQKCSPNDIKTQDIIEYQMDGYTVIHRVIKIYQEKRRIFLYNKR